MTQLHDEFRTGTGIRLRLISSENTQRSSPVRALPSVRVSDDRETPSQTAVRMVMFLITTAIVVFAVYKL